MRTNKTNIEDHKKVKVVFVTLNPNHALFWIQLIIYPNQFTLLTFVIHRMFSVYNMINQKIDTSSDNLHHQNTHVCEKQDQDDFLIDATSLRHNFALPQFMAQHNCEGLKPIDTPSTASTFTQASSDHTSNQSCAHNSMATQCNQSQCPTFLKQLCDHIPYASQVCQANLSNSLTSQYPRDPGEHV